MGKKKTFSVYVEIQVMARTRKEAEENARDFMEYGFEVSNDESRFLDWCLDGSIEVEATAT